MIDRDVRWWKSMQISWLRGVAGCFVILSLLEGCGRKPEPPAAPPAKKPVAEMSVQKAEPTTPTLPSSGYAALTNAERERVKSLYALHCAACHGENGNANGIAAKFVFPKPRDFRAGKFRLVSTSNGAPTLEDIDAVLRRGMPGSSMPPWPALSESDRKLLAEQVIEFRREGIRESERAFAAEIGDEASEEEIRNVVQDLTTPGPTIAVPPLAASTPEAVARGKQLYVSKGCAKCHGNEGKGDGQEMMVNAEGLPNLPRDLTKGIFKGSPDPESVYRRTQAGMPGSAMPTAPGMRSPS